VETRAAAIVDKVVARCRGREALARAVVDGAHDLAAQVLAVLAAAA